MRFGTPIQRFFYIKPILYLFRLKNVFYVLKQQTMVRQERTRRFGREDEERNELKIGRRF